MNKLRKSIYVLISAAFAIASCKNTSDDNEQPPPTVYAQPLVQPLQLSKIVKLNWDTVKVLPVHRVVKPFDLDKLPAQSYDTAGFKPFKYPVTETRFDYKTLPEKDLDIDKLSSFPVKFKIEHLPPPTQIHCGPPVLKDLNLSLFELANTQGLSNSFVTDIFNDRDGFLWIANRNGLYRYDGENLLFYMPIAQDHYIGDMVQDKTGRLWLTTENSGDLEVLDPNNGTLKKAERSSGLTNVGFEDIFCDKQQKIWVTTAFKNGIYIIDPESEQTRRLDEARYLSDTTAQSVVQDNKHNIWIATHKGVNIIDLQNKKIKYLNKSNGLRSDTTGILLVDPTGRVLMTMHGGLLNVIDVKKNKIQTISEARDSKYRIYCLSQDKQGKIWIGTIGNGLKIIDLESQTVKNLKKINGLKEDVILTITQSIQGQAWIGTMSGLNMINDNSTNVERIGNGQVDLLVSDAQGLVWEFIHNKKGVDIIDEKNKVIRHLGAQQGLASDSTLTATDIKGKLFMPSASGLDIIDSTGKTITHVDIEQGASKRLGYNVVADKTGRIWMNETGGMCVYDPTSNTVKHIGKAQGFDAETFNCMQTDASGRIWINTNDGAIIVIDPVNYTVQNITNNVQGFKDMDPQGPCFLDGEKGNMWIGTDKGIYIANLENKTLTALSTAQGLIDERIATLLKHHGQIYASTLSGITIINPPDEGIVTNKKWIAQSFGKEYGLEKVSPDYGRTDVISPDGLFFSGDYGVTVLDLSKKDLFLHPAFISGINIMDEPKIFKGKSQSILNGSKWDGETGPFNLPVNLQLAHDQNYLRFNFEMLNLANHDTTWYRYKLVGSDTGWSEQTTSMMSRNYFSLAPGKYTFEVVSKNPDNNWSKPAVFSFAIMPPWWQTWWAYIFYVLAFGSTIWSFVYFRSQQLVKEKRILEHKVQVRTEEVIQQKEEIETQRDNLEKAFIELKTTQTQLIQSEKMASLGELTAGIAHEIQNPLNFVNNFSEVNKEMLLELETEIKNGNTEDALALTTDIIQNEEKINHHGKRADSIVKGMLEHSRARSGQKEPTDLNVMAEEFMRLSYHGLRAKDKLFNAELVTHFDPDLPKINVIQQDMGRMLLNLFNNAFYAVNQKKKTAGAEYKAQVSVSTEKATGHVTVKIKDNGVGIPDTIKEKIMQPFFTTKPTGEGTGLGLSLTYDMVVKGHGGKIEVNTIEGEFTEFIITLPLI